MSVLQEKNRNLAYVSVSLAETATKFCVFGPSTTTGGHSFCSYCGKCTWIVDVDLRRKVIRGTHITPQILIGLSAAPSLHTSLLISTPSSSLIAFLHDATWRVVYLWILVSNLRFSNKEATCIFRKSRSKTNYRPVSKTESTVKASKLDLKTRHFWPESVGTILKMSFFDMILTHLIWWWSSFSQRWHVVCLLLHFIHWRCQILRILREKLPWCQTVLPERSI